MHRPGNDVDAAAGCLRIEPARAALLVVDFQEKLAAAMAPGDRAAAERNILLLLELARRLSIPVVISEQYPRGLGPTVAAIVQAASSLSPPASRLEKIEFACTEAAGFRELFQRLGRRQWVVTGMETHVCVWQTVRGLLEWQATVHVPADALVARAATNHATGIGLMQRAGAVMTSTETVIFDALVRAGSDDFRAMSRRIR